VSKEFNNEFDQMFSIYLSNDGQSPGDISFGGYDLDKYAKKGEKIIWADQSANEAYWAVNTNGVKYGTQNLSTQNQQVIFDNGMSLAMAPEKNFVSLVEGLSKFGFKCQESMPVWSCDGNPENYEKLPSIDMNLLLNAKGESATVKMPKEAYLKFDPSQNVFFLLISPW